MKSNIFTKLSLCCLFFLTVLTMNVSGQATVTTDKPDYAPMSNAVFSGTGFQPGEDVILKVKNLFRPCNTVLGDSSYMPWTVTADANGAFVTNWTVCNCPGDSLRLKATGQTSGYIAYALFSDGVINKFTDLTLSTDFAVGGPSPQFTALPGVLKYTSNAGDASNQGPVPVTVVLSAPANWQFEPGVGSITEDGSFFTLPLIDAIVVTSSTITIKYTTSTGPSSASFLTISGIKVQATSGTALASINIQRSGGTAITGPGWANTINCGTLAQKGGTVNNFVFNTITSPKTQGSAFNVVITAKDVFGNTSNGFTGTANLSTNAGPGTISPSVSGSFSGGISSTETVSVTLNKSGLAMTITAATSTPSATGTSNSFLVESNEHFQSKASGNWNDIATWESSPDGILPYQPATIYPTLGSKTIKIRNGHIVTVTAASSPLVIDETTVQSGGNLKINNGVTVTIFNGTLTDLTVDDGGTITNSGAMQLADGGSTTIINGELKLNNSAGGTGGLLNMANPASLVIGTTGFFTITEGKLTMGGGTPPTITINGNLTSSAAGESILLTSGSDMIVGATGKVYLIGTTFNTTTGTGPSITVQSGGRFSIDRTSLIKSNVPTSFNLNSGASLEIGSDFGISSTGTGASSGNIQVEGVRTFNVGAHYIYNGTAAQITGSGLPTLGITGSVTISNATGVTLTNNLITATLNLSGGILNGVTNSKTTTISAGGVVNRTNGWVHGSLIKAFASGTASPSFTFDIGDASVYAKLLLTGTGTTASAGSLTAFTTAGDLNTPSGSNISLTNRVHRFWTVSNTGITGISTYGATFNYPAAEAGGTPANYLAKYTNGVAWFSETVTPTPSSTSTSTTGITANSITTSGTTNQFIIGQADCTAPTFDEPVITNLSCKGDLSGAINLNQTGGSAPISYAWTGPGAFSASTEDISGLAAGTYSVTINGGDGCITIISGIQVTEPATVVSVTKTSQANVLCKGASTGAINITAAGGTGAYSYAWTGTGVNATSEDQTGLAAGNYSVVVSDANGCATAPLNVTITEPATVVSVTKTSQANVLCKGASTGAINITAAGGTGAYSYAWTGTGVNATSEDQTGLAAGNYSVVVSDANGCATAPLNVTITEPETVVSVTKTSQANVLCKGASTGAINITAAGGTGAYSYAWTGTGVNATSEDQTGLAAGNYSVVVSDANGCATAPLNVTITEPATVVSVTKTSQANVLCKGASTGAINITAAGGTGAYSYAWTGTGVNATSEDQTGLAAGNYSVVVSDANGCATAPLNVTITEPATVVSVTKASQANVLCKGASTGAINITAAGGTGAYSYAWTGTGVNATSEDQTGLAAGNYSVVVSDANGCATAPLNVTITEPATVVSVTKTSQANVLCKGASTGAINITAAGGTGAYSYAWTGTGVNATSEDQTGLAAGNYSVVVSDANGCATAPLNVTITEPATVVSVTKTSQANVLCKGASTGAINITAAGGTGAYSYAWTGTGVNATSEDQTGLAAGNYSVVVSDANGCATAPLNVTITEPATVVSVTKTSQANVLCKGASTGAINITAAGGTGAYSYAWTGTGVNATSEDQTGLAAGNYSVVVSDANGCATAPLNVTITEPATVVSVTKTSQANVLCKGASTGAINITAAGGTGAYSYAWTGTGVNATSEDQTGLAAGNYSVVVSDANGCATAPLNVTITEPETVVSVTKTSQANVLCKGASTGAINITAAGGTGAYSYAWTGTGVNATSEDQTGLAAGNYSVVVSDANGCATAPLNVTITEPETVVSVTKTSQANVLCKGASTGAINITAAGGTGAYSYAWTGTGVNATSEDQTGLAAGNYSVVVSDANGCATAPLNVTITEPATVVSVTKTSQANVLCKGASTGAINITAAGGTGAYSYAWTGTGVNATSEDQTGLAAGNYSVVVSDANGCATAPLNVTITEPATVVSVTKASQANVLCKGASTGAINITAAGGTGAYSYAWTGTGVNATSEDQTGLAAGNYSVVVSDANGCATAPLNVTITEPATVVSVTKTSQANVLCKGASTGAINITAAGGTGAYSYAWTGTGVNATSEDQTGLAAGNYSVVVSDANGCATAPLNVTITEPATVVSVTKASQANVLCKGASTGAINITAAGGTGAYSYAWTGTGVNATSEDQTGLAAGNYSVVVSDANGCATAPLNVTITEPATVVSVTKTSQANVLCKGASTGAINITAAGGTGAYSYAWTGTGVNATSEDQTGLAAGNYSVVVSDANGCATAPLNVTITEPATVVSVTKTSQANVLCKGASTGAINITAAGGTGAYSYAWTGTGVNATSEDQTGLAAGNYSVVVSDANGCATAPLNVTITEPAAALVASSSAGTISCNGGTTTVTVSATGGTAPYTGTGTFTVSAGPYSYTVTDAKGCTSTTTGTVTQPVAYTVDASASSMPVQKGSAFSFKATVTPGVPGITVYFYLDGNYQGSGITDNSGYAFYPSTAPALPEVYLVTAVAGGTSSAGPGCAQSTAYLAVYDPNGGFVTGGGWIWSQAGSYIPNPLLEGKANFGFVSKYKKGSSTPEGNTEFQFKAGNINFSSISYNSGSLVIAGSKAIYKGVGTINGAGNYGFMVSAVDGQMNGGNGLDKFRMRIWDKANGDALVYDNNLSVPENEPATTVLGGGSIVIHQPSGGSSARGVTTEITDAPLEKATAPVIAEQFFGITVIGANPTSSEFMLKLQSPVKDMFEVNIIDQHGSIVQVIKAQAGQTLRFGNNYARGTYFAQVRQAGKSKVVKLLKL